MTASRGGTLPVLADYIGDEAAGRLAAAFGGCQIKIPKRHHGVWWQRLAEAIGEREAAELCRAFGGESLYIPRNAAASREALRRLVLQRLRAGETYGQIARTVELRFRYSERGLRKLVEGAAGRRRQKSTLDR